ncbi:MAG: laccase domain-containing protein [Deltaproteobacteria bacterium]|nr:laccase domain-containing protein [Deltaproteobacteria bacterium]
MPLLRAGVIPAGFDHGFTTRDVDPDALFAQRTDLRLFRGLQVHRADVIVVQGDEDPYDVVAEAADIVCTARARVAVGVVTADCVPILLCAPAAAACAAVHAGWRGTVQRAVQVGVAALVKRLGARVDDVRAAIGPAICGPCYEVGDDVAAEVAAVDPGAVTRGPSGRAHADLRRCNRTLLCAAGVPAAQIEDLHACTRCDPAGRFHSYRRNRELRGEQLAFIGRPG